MSTTPESRSCLIIVSGQLAHGRHLVGDGREEEANTRSRWCAVRRCAPSALREGGLRCADGESLHEAVVLSYSEVGRTRFVMLPAGNDSAPTTSETLTEPSLKRPDRPCTGGAPVSFSADAASLPAALAQESIERLNGIPARTCPTPTRRQQRSGRKVSGAPRLPAPER